MWIRKERVFWVLAKLAKNREANLFLAIALCVGMVFVFLNPPLQECDGERHFLWAMDVSYGNLCSPFLNVSSHEDGMLTVPKNLEEIEFCTVMPESRMGGECVRSLKSTYFSSETGEIGLEGAYVSFYYYPQALGLFLSRLLGLDVYWSVAMSRICNLLLFLLLSYLSIRITPIMKHTLAVVALLPMSVYQAASDSPDAMLNGLCFLFAALCFSYAYGEKERLGWRDVWKLGLLLGVIFLCKYVYVCLGFLVFLIPMRKFGTKKEYWKCFSIALLPLAVIGGLGVLQVYSAVSVGQSCSGTGGMTQTQYLTQHPKFIVQVLVTTFMSKFNDFMEMLDTLGSLNYPLGPLKYIVPMFAMFVGGADTNALCRKIKGKDRAVCLTVFASIAAGIVMAMYIGDGQSNKVGDVVVKGVQGRYFIPAMPPFFAAFVQKGERDKEKLFSWAVMGFAGAFLLYAVWSVYSYCYC